MNELPITLVTASLLGIMFIWLSARVISGRVKVQSLIGHSDDEVHVNSNEIAAWRWLSVDELEQEMAEQPRGFTPWFRMEWDRIRAEFADVLEIMTGGT